ncbi:hypothetical protein ACFQ9D_12020 [Arthrobacter koreensis]|uniref:hypothetical protein n=1 Tax=Arthrobacter koreensis TaxID=199136 RepID=UPI003638B6BB
MNRKTIHGIDLTAPGGLEALFAYRRAQFGAAMMMADGGDGGEGGDAGAGGGNALADGGDKGGEKGGDTGAQEWDGKVESLPADAQRIIADLRKEAGDERVAAKTLAAIQKALNPDAKGDEKPDAAALTKALTEREADAKQAKTELAVYRLAGKNGADPDALLDSRGFLAKLADLDPSDTAKITKAITDAVKDNPKLKAVLAAGASGADLTGGSGEKRNRSNVTLDSALTSHYGK